MLEKRAATAQAETSPERTDQDRHRFDQRARLPKRQRGWTTSSAGQQHRGQKATWKVLTFSARQDPDRQHPRWMSRWTSRSPAISTVSTGSCSTSSSCRITHPQVLDRPARTKVDGEMKTNSRSRSATRAVQGTSAHDPSSRHHQRSRDERHADVRPARAQQTPETRLVGGTFNSTHVARLEAAVGGFTPQETQRPRAAGLLRRAPRRGGAWST